MHLNDCGIELRGAIWQARRPHGPRSHDHAVGFERHIVRGDRESMGIAPQLRDRHSVPHGKVKGGRLPIQIVRDLIPSREVIGIARKLERRKCAIAQISFDHHGRPALRMLLDDAPNPAPMLGLPSLAQALAQCWRCVRMGRTVEASCQPDACQCDYQQPLVECA